MPMLVMADYIIEPMMTRTLKYLQISGLVPDTEKEHLNDIVERMGSLINSKWVQLILALLAVAFSWFLQSDYTAMWAEREVTSWVLHQENGEVDETLAGTWSLFVSSPLISFLLYRWVWRFVVWSKFLYRISRIKLELQASHTDLAGGLGVIGAEHLLFGFLFFIIAMLISSELAGYMLYEGVVLLSVKHVAIVFITTSIVIILLPLLCFSKKLISLKQKALIQYGVLQHQVSNDFHRHWIKEEANDLVDSMQPSAMADYSAIYMIISNMRIVPVNPKMLLILAVGLLIPFLPLVLIQSSFWDILHKIGVSLV